MRTPLWVQRLKAQSLLAVARTYPSFPIVLETYRQALQTSSTCPPLAEPGGSTTHPGPRRAAGVRVVLVGGEPVFFLQRGERKLLSLLAADDRRLAALAAAALESVARWSRGKALRLQEIDGEPARKSALASLLEAAGFQGDFTGLMLLITEFDSGSGMLRAMENPAPLHSAQGIPIQLEAPPGVDRWLNPNGTVTESDS